MIERVLIDRMFERARGFSWDLFAPCRWSYFFIARDQIAFESLADRLSADGYRIVGTLDTTPDDDSMTLRVDRNEEHTPASLDARNAHLSALAASLVDIVYDGMDVGPIDSP